MRIERDQIKTLAIIGVMAAVFVGGLWLPQRLEEQRLRESIEQAQKQLGFDRAASEGLAALNQTVLDLRETVDRTRKEVPERDDLADLLRTLTRELESRQISEVEIQNLPVLAGDDYSVMPLTLRFRASAPATFGFVKHIEDMRRLVRVTRVEIAPDPSKPNEPPMARVELCAFFAPEREARTR
jgi:Tfp pilus assembly protein PilO